MSPVDALSGYLDRCVRRLRCHAWLRGAAMVVLAALLLTIALTWTMSRIPASPRSLRAERLVLLAGILAAAVLSVRARIGRDTAARLIEARLPAFSQQLVTFVERAEKHRDDPFLPLLADGALPAAAAFTPRDLVSGGRFAAASMTLIAAACALLFLVLTGTNAGVLWGRREAFRVDLKAARNTVRRGGEWTVQARVSGFAATQATLRVRNAGDREWQSIPLLPEGQDAVFAIQLPTVARSMEYYAESNGVRSPVSRLKVVDLPNVTGIRVILSGNSAPAPAADGDIIAPAGAIANIEVETDRPLNGGQLVFEEADPIALTPNARFRVLRNDGYHVSVRYAGEDVPISGEHSIEVLTDEGPAPKGLSLLEGGRVGPMPSGYEKAVSEYYRRLSEQQAERR
ncbi:MAG TPA: hypothetical protein VN519_14340 [Bryobacteraceae bacterium]|nr:hypothetical protein [Bryobacteraceae bacterium]